MLKLKIQKLRKVFNQTKIVLDDINLDIKNGESVVILGGSGSGKSVFIKTIASILKATSGSIEIDGIEVINNKNPEQFIDKMGFLFQNGALFDSLTIWENVVFKIVNSNNKIKYDKRKIKELAITKLIQVGLNETHADLFPYEISGGMQKRVALARAIADNPEIVFFDEPTTGLDPVLADVINDLIVSCSKAIKATTITITHDINSALKIGDRIVFLHEGRFIWSGLPSELFTSNNEHLNVFIAGIKSLFST